MILRGGIRPRRPADRTETRFAPIESWNDLIRAVVEGGGTDPLHNDMVQACVDRICRDVSLMPKHEIRSSKGKRKNLDASQLVAEPSVRVDEMDWTFQVLQSWVLRGNAFGLVTEVDRQQYPLRIELLNPDDCKWHESDTKVSVGSGRPQGIWPLGDIWHAPGRPGAAGSRRGISVLEHHASTFRTGLEVMRFAREFFENGGSPPGVLTLADKPSDVQLADVKLKFIDKLRSREPLILPKDSTWVPLSPKPEEMAYIQLMQLTDEKIARVFGVFPQMVGAPVTGGGSLVYTNPEMTARSHVTWTLLYWIRKLEKQLSLLLPGKRQVRVNPDVVMKADIGARYATYKTAAEIQKLTGETLLGVPEMRELEDREPLPDAPTAEPDTGDDT